MIEKTVLSCIKQMNRPVFTTFEVSRLSGKSSSTVIQTLNRLKKQGVVFKICRGIWAEVNQDKLSAFTVVPFLFPTQRVYVSFVSALHYYGIIEQIPQTITIASTAHTRMIKTTIGTYSVHRICPSFFEGFLWDRTRSFLIAEPEKALIDSLYLSAYKRKYFGHFPELFFPKTFSLKKVNEWCKAINNIKVRTHVERKLKKIHSEYQKSK